MIKDTNKMDYFDDCAICRAMKEADKNGRQLTESQLLEAFKKAKEQDAKVGGDYFDKLSGKD